MRGRAVTQALMRNSKLKYRARDLRTQPTDAERALWRCLRSEQLSGWKFRRQHADSAYNSARNNHLRKHGWRVLRFWNNDVLNNPEGVAATILAAIGGPKLPEGE